MKRVLFILALICALGFMCACARADTAENMQIVYTYLTETLGYNRAVACGIMSNIQYESNFRPNAIGDSGKAYGICQWNSRRQSMINYCERNGFESWQDIYGQLGYLGYELVNNKKKVGAYLSTLPDTPQGAYDAGWYFCVYFEIPASRYTKGVKRGTTAVKKYYTMYGGTYETYTVSFDAAGGSAPPSAQQKTEGVPLTLPTGAPVKPGSVFTGWSEAPLSPVPDYAPGDSYTRNCSATLYALWALYTPDDILYTVEEDECAIIGYIGDSAQVTVPAAIDGLPVTRIDAGAFENEALTVYVPLSVTDIAPDAFAQGARIAGFPGGSAHRWALQNGFEFTPVYGSAAFTAGSELKSIGFEAFEGADFVCVDLSRSHITELGANVFSACPRLKVAALPESLVTIEPDAFPTGTLILAPSGSYAEKYAGQYKYEFLPLD